MIRPVLAALFVLSLAAAPVAAAGIGDLAAPWPDLEDGTGGTPVTFPSSSPFSPLDVGKGAKADPPT